ncbi:hypothetical protein BDQ94DRAFT_154197, partial [Aspergillus welwitschiae]
RTGDHLNSSGSVKWVSIMSARQRREDVSRTCVAPLPLLVLSPAFEPTEAPL